MNKKHIFDGLFFALFAIMGLVGFFYVLESKRPDPTPTWEQNIVFATSTPEIGLDTEGGWWDDASTKPTALPTMPGGIAPTSTPLSATQTALALTPSITPTRTPLFDVNATATSTATAED